jgi:hypothetical protein
MPKSTCQTSPRSGTPRFLLIQRAEGIRSEGREIIVREVVRHWDVLDDLTAEFDTLCLREVSDLVNDVCDSGCHE